jgi:exopolysaccharide biosynthesis operon protein EpsL
MRHLWVVSACAAAVSPPLQALNNDTLFLRGTTSMTYDSNVFRISDDLSNAAAESILQGEGRSDLIWGLGAGLRMDLPVSRQRFRLDLSATRYQYNDFDQLDYTGYGLEGIWDWRVGNDWYGQVNLGARQARQTYSTDIAVLVPRLYRTYDALVDVRHALTPQWELQTSLSASETDYKDDVFRVDDFEYWAADVGASYRTALGNSTGVRLRYEDGNWPNRPPGAIEDEYTQYTLSAVLDWRLTGKSRLYGDAGYTFRDQSASNDRDFDGPSGRLTYEYSVTHKSTLRASLYQTRGAVEDFTATYIKTTGVDLAWHQQATSKITLQASASFREQDYLGESLVPGVQRRRDDLTTFGLVASYQATRTLSVSAGAQYDERSSNIPLGDYDAYTLYLSALIEF